MKKSSYRIICILALLLILLPINVNANIICNDGTVSPSCSDCHRGCCSHHGGCSSGATNNYSNNNTSGSSSYVPQQPIVKEKPKSNDASLKKVTIDNENIDISDNMSYSTTKKIVNIYAVPNDNKATIKYNSGAELNIGDNTISIKVTAENGNVKEYKLNIIREKVLSGNKNIKITVDGKEVPFDSSETGTIYLSDGKDKIDIEYELEDKNAKAEIIGNENLKVGKNEVIVKVTAENGEVRDYTIMVGKYDKIEENNLSIVVIIFIIGLVSGLGYLIYYFIKKARKA